MVAKWKDQVEFVTVYVREAHPVDDVPATGTNAKAGFLIKQPVSLDERCAVAERCYSTLNLQSTMVVDEIDNRVGQAYAAAPDRLYVVDRKGLIAYRGGPGPFGFNPQEMEQTLMLLLFAQEQKALETK